ncbi:MAG: M20/M25/M40 family metallo-hydrolase [Acidobacteriia bacterium]|nr:M20/M25/M40 family metallo-hydrolase [Terriglobia bacterium]
MDDVQVIPQETTAEVAGRIFPYGRDFVLGSPIGTAANGGVAYAGDGWFIKAEGHDPYQSLNVKDKFVIVASAEPPNDLLRGKYGEDWAKPADAARARGAKGIIYMSGMPRVWTADHKIGVAAPAEPGSVPFLEIMASRELLDALFDKEALAAAEILAGLPKNPRDAWKTGGPLLNGFGFNANKNLRLHVGIRSAHPNTRNVIVLLEGSDPELKREYVVLGAHYDALPEDDGPAHEAHPGADDNGSGAVALLAIAEAMVKAPKPRRSILFIWHTGEEELGWGSRYFTEHPTVPLNRIVAFINMDMIGRTQNPGDPPQQLPRVLSGPDEVEANGSANLVEVTRNVNMSYLGMRIVSRKHWGGSDHEVYRAKGLPVLWITTGDHAEMHTAGDTADRIDYDKMERIARTIYATGRYLADAR